MIERSANVPAPPTNAPVPLPLAAMDAAPAGPNDLHELRVRIPVELHRQLLSLKVLRGRSLAETVSLALDIYFQERAGQKPEPDEPASANA